MTTHKQQRDGTAPSDGVHPKIRAAWLAEHARTQTVLAWISGIRIAMPAPQSDFDCIMAATIECLFQRARRQERAAYIATLETPDDVEFDS